MNREDELLAIKKYLKSAPEKPTFFCHKLGMNIRFDVCDARRKHARKFPEGPAEMPECRICKDYKYWHEGKLSPSQTKEKSEGIERLKTRQKRSSNPPYGFQLKNNRYVPNLDEVEVLGWIVTLRQTHDNRGNKMSFQKIANRLNSDGHRNRKGRKFTAQCVRGLFASYQVHRSYLEI